MDVRVKRVYEEPEPGDGFRVLVDRIWPRGISRSEAHFDEWDRSVAPSTDLRVWFGHDPARFEKFRASYLEELRNRRPALAGLRSRARRGTLTLLYAARDPVHNHAVVLAEAIRRGVPRHEGSGGSAGGRDDTAGGR